VRERGFMIHVREFVTHMRESLLCYAFDDALDHEVWHDGVGTCIVRESRV